MFAQVGINTSTPVATLDVVGSPAINTVYDGVIPPRITGNQLAAKTYTIAQIVALVYVLDKPTITTNPQTRNVLFAGLYQFDGAQWHIPMGKAPVIYGVLGTAGSSSAFNVAGYTGGVITLPPGKWLVNVQMIVKMQADLAVNKSFWIKSTFSDVNTGTLVRSPDIVGASLISALIVGPSRYAMMNGFIRINNSGTTSKSYYYWKDGGGEEYGGGVVGTNGTLLEKFGANATVWGENIIYAMPYVD